MSSSCHLDRVSNDEFTQFSVEFLFRFFQPTQKSDLKVVQITKIISFEIMNTYNTLNVPQIKKGNNSKYLTINTDFDIRRSVQRT